MERRLTDERRAKLREEAEASKKIRKEKKKKKNAESLMKADGTIQSAISFTGLYLLSHLFTTLYLGHCSIAHYGSGCLILCRGIKGQDVLRLIEFQIYRCAAKPVHAVTVLKSPIIRPPGPVE